MKASGKQHVMVVCHGGVIRMLYSIYQQKEVAVVEHGDLHEFDI